VITDLILLPDQRLFHDFQCQYLFRIFFSTKIDLHKYLSNYTCIKALITSPKAPFPIFFNKVKSESDIFVASESFRPIIL
jgi:hypothetical protein